MSHERGAGHPPVFARGLGGTRGEKSATGCGAGIPPLHFPLQSFEGLGKVFCSKIFGRLCFQGADLLPGARFAGHRGKKRPALSRTGGLECLTLARCLRA